MSAFGMFSKFTSARRLLSKAQRYAQQNPDKVRRYTDKAARFADKQTKGRYRDQIDKAVRKADDLTGQGPRGGQRGDPYPGPQPGGSQPGGSQPGGPQPGGPQPGGQQPDRPHPGGPHTGPRRDDPSDY